MPASPIPAAPSSPLSRRRRFVREMRSWIVSFAVAIAILAPLRSAVADWNDVPTGSMEPTILPGDRIFVNKLAYGLRVPFTSTWVARWGDPKSGDVVVLFSPNPGRIQEQFVVDLPRPRDEDNPNVIALKKQIRTLIHNEFEIER